MAAGTNIPTRTMLGQRGSIDRLSSQEFTLVLLNTDRAGTSFPIKDELRIGKAPDNDVVIEHATVSRNHLVVKRQKDRFLVQDLGSTNGTFLDGAQIREAFLKPGVLLELGDVQLRFQPELKGLLLAPADDANWDELVGQSLPMRQMFTLFDRIAKTDSTMLLIGETGTGKGAAAKAIHRRSPRADGPFIVFDCAAVSETLIESELFGHEKGAFTGAIAQRVGCLQRADTGTLFLDEIDDLSLDLQPKLLRALEDREFRRLGASSGPIPFDVRVIAASKKDLWAEAKAGRFREDLYFRLSVFTVTLPPLRDRKEDIPLLVDACAHQPTWEQLPTARQEAFLAHTWPGNVRELRNAVERLKHGADLDGFATDVKHPTLTEARAIGGDVLPVQYEGPFKTVKDDLMRAFEREYLRRLLSKAHGNIAKAAREADVDRKHLYSLLEKHGLQKSSSDGADE